MAGEKLTRRSFFRLAGGGIAAAVIAPQLLMEKIINIPVEFGWTWYVDKNNVPNDLSKLVSRTLAENTQSIAANLGKNNALLMKLKDGTKVNLQIEQITEQAQNERMNRRTKDRIVQREKERLSKLDYLDDTNKEWLKKRSDAALSSNGFDWDERHVPLKTESENYIEQRRKDLAAYLELKKQNVST